MKIFLPLRAYSINDFYNRDARFGVKAAAKEWQYQVNWILQNYAQQFSELRARYDKSKHAFAVRITVGYSHFYTKAGEIYHLNHDLSNIEKPLQDLIFCPKNFGTAPYKAPNLNIDDKTVVSLTSRKVPSETDFIKVSIRLVNKP